LTLSESPPLNKVMYMPIKSLDSLNKKWWLLLYLQSGEYVLDTTQ